MKSSLTQSLNTQDEAWEQLSTATSLLYKIHSTRSMVSVDMDKLNFIADKTFYGLDPTIKELRDQQETLTRQSHKLAAATLSNLENESFIPSGAKPFLTLMVYVLPIFLSPMMDSKRAARAVSLSMWALSIIGSFSRTNYIPELLLDNLQVSILFMPGVINSKKAIISLTALNVIAEVYTIWTPFELWNGYGAGFLFYVLDWEYLSGNPVPQFILVVVNIVYLLAILIILAKDLRSTKAQWEHYYLKFALFLLKFLPKQSPKDTRFEDFIEICATGERKSFLKQLLEDHNFNLNQRQLDTGNTGLHLATFNQRMNIIQALLDSKRSKSININMENIDRKTPLMIAAGLGNHNIVRRLMKQPKLKLKGYYGEGAIIAAVQGEHYFVALSVAEEITKRGLCLKDCSKYLKNTTLLQALKKCASLDRQIGRRVSDEAQQPSLFTLKDKILRAMLDKHVDGEAKEKLTQVRICEDLKDFLECSICFEEFGDTPVLACTNDHWICSSCYPRNKFCPWCREDIQRTVPRRCRTSEKILKLIVALEIPKN